MFTSYTIRDIIWAKEYTQIIALVDEKEKHVYFEEYSVVVSEFDYRQLLDLIVLYIIAISTKMSFNILIDLFRLFISFKIKSCWQFAYNAQTITFFFYTIAINWEFRSNVIKIRKL